MNGAYTIMKNIKTARVWHGDIINWKILILIFKSVTFTEHQAHIILCQPQQLNLKRIQLSLICLLTQELTSLIVFQCQGAGLDFITRLDYLFLTQHPNQARYM